MNERRQTQATTQAGSLFPAINSGDDDGVDGSPTRMWSEGVSDVAGPGSRDVSLP